MMVPVSLLVLILLWKVLVGVGAGVAFWWVSEKPDPAVELDSACCVLLGLDVRDSVVDVDSAVVDEETGVDVDVDVEVVEDEELEVSDVEHGAKSVETGICTTC